MVRLFREDKGDYESEADLLRRQLEASRREATRHWMSYCEEESKARVFKDEVDRLREEVTVLEGKSPHPLVEILECLPHREAYDEVRDKLLAKLMDRYGR